MRVWSWLTRRCRQSECWLPRCLLGQPEGSTSAWVKGGVFPVPSPVGAQALHLRRFTMQNRKMLVSRKLLPRKVFCCSHRVRAQGRHYIPCQPTRPGNPDRGRCRPTCPRLVLPVAGASRRLALFREGPGSAEDMPTRRQHLIGGQRGGISAWTMRRSGAPPLRRRPTMYEYTLLGS